MWYDFFGRCLDICALNFESMLRQGNANLEKEMMSLPETVLEEIFERAFTRLHKQANSSALDTIVKFLLKAKGASSIFELL